MEKIQLTQNQYASVNNEDYERLNKFKWYALKVGKRFYAIRHSSSIKEKSYSILMHHVVLGRPPKGFEIDHIDGCGTNNCKENLRFVTRRQNSQNRKEKGSSRYPGVYWNKPSKRWLAQIWANNKRKHIGCFTNEIDAFNAYKQAVSDIGENMVMQSW